jgi:hypothetical protein
MDGLWWWPRELGTMTAFFVVTRCAMFGAARWYLGALFIAS